MGRLLKVKENGYQSWEDCLRDFLLFKSAQGFSDRTLVDYEWHVTKFFKNYPKIWGDINKIKKAVMMYFAKGRDLAPATHNMRRKYLKAFFAWTVQEGILILNPIEGISIRREEPRVRDMDNDKLQRLLSAPDQTTYSGLRDYALLCLSLDTGIRPKEALSLLPDNVNLRSMEVTIPSPVAKTRVSRILPVTPVTINAVRKLITAHPASWRNAPIFATAEGKIMSSNAWTKRLGYYSRKLAFKVSPYDLRHAFALMFLRNGGNALALQKTLGHVDLAMTKRYVALTQQDLREQHLLASPLNLLIPTKERLRKIKK